MKGKIIHSRIEALEYTLDVKDLREAVLDYLAKSPMKPKDDLDWKRNTTVSFDVIADPLVCRMIYRREKTDGVQEIPS